MLWVKFQDDARAVGFALFGFALAQGAIYLQGRASTKLHAKEAMFHLVREETLNANLLKIDIDVLGKEIKDLADKHIEYWFFPRLRTSSCEIYTSNGYLFAFEQSFVAEVSDYCRTLSYVNDTLSNVDRVKFTPGIDVQYALGIFDKQALDLITKTAGQSQRLSESTLEKLKSL